MSAYAKNLTSFKLSRDAVDASKDCSAYMIPGLPLRERRTFEGYASVSMALRFSSQIPLQSP